MKRPNGFPPPPPPGQQAPASSPTPPKSVRPIRPAAKAGAAPQPNAEPESPASPKSASARSTSRDTAPKPASTAAKSATIAAKSRDTAPNHFASRAPSPSRTRSDEALARKNVRVAERKRRRYERSEARRFTERSRRRRLTWIISAAVLVGLVLVVVFTAYSPLFAVRSVDIEGTSRIDASQVQSALADQLGKPLALVDYGAIKNDLATFTLIQSYSTESQLPNTLVIRIVERQPVGAVASGTGFDLVDPAGVVVAHSDQRPDGFPTIDLAGGPVGSPGFLGATAVLAALPADLLAKVDSVSAATPDSVTLVLTGSGQKVVWGSVDNSALKAEVLDKLIGTQSPNDAVTYDVSSPDTPIVS
ncbi:MAG: cell division protein FtsQ [Subtercola sp.]|nr:cell division protein FtsQ [Subtercola sp.]